MLFSGFSKISRFFEIFAQFPKYGNKTETFTFVIFGFRATNQCFILSQVDVVPSS